MATAHVALLRRWNTLTSSKKKKKVKTSPKLVQSTHSTRTKRTIERQLHDSIIFSLKNGKTRDNVNYVLDEEIRKIHDTAPFGSKLLVISVSHFDESCPCPNESNREKKFPPKKKKKIERRRGIRNKGRMEMAKSNWESFVKVIRHNLTFRETAATPPTTDPSAIYIWLAIFRGKRLWK